MIRDGDTTIKITFSLFEGGGALGTERKIIQNAVFRGKRHDNKILKVQILLSSNFVVIAQAPSLKRPFSLSRVGKIASRRGSRIGAPTN